MKKIRIPTLIFLLSLSSHAFGWKINCQIYEENKNQSDIAFTFSKSLNLKTSKKVTFGKNNLFLKIEKGIGHKKSLLSIRNYDSKNKNKIERIWTVGRFIHVKDVASRPFQLAFTTNGNKKGILKCKGL
jgi:hypothetical protein